MTVTNDEYINALLVLETARDDVETTDDETRVLQEAHSILQEYRKAGEL
ncbi:hypothetical protein HTZ84_09635 [Haloterrigena sp. SYSU A558-1]|uniref:Uncharacterized protein n=1 Tax=Haloterrigena gelatinilytica TaxID=2741724 RepID=A0ABX2L8H7_9EURY|nr:hypothetical protein [Haloterrigena gelatinilytica]NUC72567.1 hypothetical protein [Haloterrigena gelatinilytica]